MRLISWIHPHGSGTVYFLLGLRLMNETRQERQESGTGEEQGN
jgi:hypothetical protein